MVKPCQQISDYISSAVEVLAKQQFKEKRLTDFETRKHDILLQIQRFRTFQKDKVTEKHVKDAYIIIVRSQSSRKLRLGLETTLAAYHEFNSVCQYPCEYKHDIDSYLYGQPMNNDCFKHEGQFQDAMEGAIRCAKKCVNEHSKKIIVDELSHYSCSSVSTVSEETCVDLEEEEREEDE